MLAASVSVPQLAPWALAPLAMGVVFALLLAVLGRVPLRYNVRNLQVRWTTTGLTAVAFVIVLGLLTLAGIALLLSSLPHLLGRL